MRRTLAVLSAALFVGAMSLPVWAQNAIGASHPVQLAQAEGGTNGENGTKAENGTNPAEHHQEEEMKEKAAPANGEAGTEEKAAPGEEQAQPSGEASPSEESGNGHAE